MSVKSSAGAPMVNVRMYGGEGGKEGDGEEWSE